MPRIVSKNVPGAPGFGVFPPNTGRATVPRGGKRSVNILQKRDEAKGISQPEFSSAYPVGVKASLTTALTGTNNDLTITAKREGTAGNSITVAYVVAGASTPLSVSVTGNAITVNVGTSGASAAISTAASVRDMLNGNPASSALVTAANATGNDGTGVVAALTATALSGGVNGSETFAGPGVPSTTSYSVVRQKPLDPPGGTSGRKRISKASTGPLTTR